MARPGASKKKKSPRPTELSQLKKELQRVTEQLESRDRELAEASEREAATGDILRVIASSPNDLQPVLDVVTENAARLCESKNAVIFRLDGAILRLAAIYGPVAVPPTEIPLSRVLPVCRAVLERQTIHVPDIAAEYPEAHRLQQLTGTRAALATPLLRGGVPVGAIIILRVEARPFTDRQIVLLKTFADQAVIAIENVRLFKELENRNRDLTEALQQQTATSEILRVIASSPTDLQPVFETIVNNARRLCGADSGGLFRFDGELLHFVTMVGQSAEWRSSYVTGEPFRPGRETATRLAALERRVVHVPDILAAPEFTEYQTGRHAREGIRSALAVPLLKDDTLLGVITISHRPEARQFTDGQIALVKTFADQAVIAIENVRLFNELKESLEQQTATSEILGVVAGSPTEIQPVLDVVAATAARLCESTDAQIRLVEGDRTRLVASFGTLGAPEFRPIIPANPSGRAIFSRETVHIHDLQQATKTEFSENEGAARGVRTFLGTPMLREGIPIGVIVIRRTELRPFSDRQIKLLETFADQAVIAIENVRLFKELQERNAELREALEHQTATSEVLGIISRSPTDVQPVLDAIVE